MASGPRVAAKYGFDAVPEYVQQGKAACSLCGQKGLFFGLHAPPQTDLCCDCFDRFQHDSDEAVLALAARLGPAPAFVEFRPVPTPEKVALLERMVVAEHNLRMSDEVRAPVTFGHVPLFSRS
jgi:hypothetical protein